MRFLLCVALLPLATATNQGHLLSSLDPQCQATADSYCTACYRAIKNRPCDGAMVARHSGPSTTHWRCYSPSTLANNATYVKGTCYCTRDAEIASLISKCQRSDVTTVFSAGMGGSKCYRIPTIIHTSKGTLLAFAEQRVNGCGDNGENNLVVRRSSDNGETWSNIITILKGNGHPLSNPNPVEVALSDDSRSVLLHFDTQNNPSTSHHGKNLQMWSHDDGVTWTDQLDITSYMPSGYAGCMPGPSVGIQASDGTIYFSCHGFGLNAFLYWSMDFGKTWKTSKTISPLNECSVAFLKNETIAMNCRVSGGRNSRAQLTWSASGTPGAITHPHGLDDPGCQGSLVSLGGVLYLSNDGTTRGRTHMTVKHSTDDGVTWSKGLAVWDGPSGYSQLVGWKASSGNVLGVLFELGDKTTYERIGFAKLRMPQHQQGPLSAFEDTVV